MVPWGWVALCETRTMSLAVPRPSLSLHPSQGVSVGDTVTLRCNLSRLAAWVWLYHVGGWTLNKYKDKEQDVVEFSFVSTSREHAGRYQCQYRVPESVEISEKSDPVELVVTVLSPPLMQIPASHHPASPFALRNMWGQGPMSPSAAGTRTMGPTSSCTRMSAQLLSCARSLMVGAQPPDHQTPQVLHLLPMGTWWCWWLGAALLPLYSSSSLSSPSYSLPADVAYGEMRALVPPQKILRPWRSKCPLVTARV
ncbi:uncharacterized protein LOC110391013 isoform X2 [Numida meleagris]|uniref:uncharacterized protein LOC110391013 isoform X2 n=1 Tax=Numida meleagris TaxID=8996 RepID=UPI000B3DCBA8|nr:uncharacterized protein LOC110391013 isoform X2 [Numida meleagris]